MAEDSDSPTDDSQKTEDPTERRLEKAFEEGQIAFSKELLHLATLASAAALLLWIFPHIMKNLLATFKSIFQQCGDELFSNVPSPVYGELTIRTTFILLVLFIVPLAAIAIGFAQTRLNFTASHLMPKLERISMTAGFKRIFSKSAFVEFLKSIIKVCLVGVIMVWSIWGYKTSIKGLSALSLSGGLKILDEIFKIMFIAALSMITVIAGFDYIYQRFSHWNKLKMSKQEVKEEIKDQEGSPEIKAKIREIRNQRARARMAESVKKATAVITNPTHYAVAILWDEDTMETPRVIAKGADYLALHIRKIAEDSKVPIVENPPLARSLYEKVDVDKDILPEQYKAVADVIHYVNDLKNKWFN